MWSPTAQRPREPRLPNCSSTTGLRSTPTSSTAGPSWSNSRVRHSSTILNRIPSSPALTRPESADDLAPFVCQRDSCPNAGSAEAGKVCYDHRISITFASETPPPMYLCIECANEIHRSHPNQMFYDILHPMQQVSMICENKVSRVSPKFHFDLLISTGIGKEKFFFSLR